MNQNSFRFTYLAILTCYFCSMTSSQAATEESSSEIESIEVLGTRMGSSSNESTIEIEPYDYQSLEGVLDRLPSVQVNANSGMGSMNEIYIQGADPNYTLVTFNGIPLNDGTNNRGGVADLSALNTFLVDKIEVVTGAQSSIYGSQAVAGAINIVAETSKFPTERNARLRLGADTRSGFIAGAGLDLQNISLDIVTSKAPETYVGSYAKSKALVLVAEPTLSMGEASITFLATDADSRSFGDDSGGARFSETGALESRQGDDLNVSAKYSLLLGDTLLSFQGYAQKKEQAINTPAVRPGIRDPQGFPASNVVNKMRRSNISAFVRHHYDGVTLLFGADFTSETGESAGELDFEFFTVPTNFHTPRDIRGVFTEFDVQVLDQLSIRLAGRYDDTSDEDAFTPSTLLTWRHSDAHQLQIKWGKGFKLPSFYAIGHPLIGNADLVSEKSETKEVVYQFKADYANFELTFFDNQFENLIDFEAGPPPRLVNRNQTQIKGATIDLVGKETTSDWNWRFNYSYLDTETDNNQILLGRAKHQGLIEMQKFVPELGAKLRFLTRYQGSRFASSIPTGQIKTKSSVDFSIDSEWQVTKNLSLLVGLRNVLNEELEFTPGNLHKGRYAWTSLDYLF